MFPSSQPGNMATLSNYRCPCCATLKTMMGRRETVHCLCGAILEVTDRGETIEARHVVPLSDEEMRARFGRLLRGCTNRL